jgi:hypothetical protein
MHRSQQYLPFIASFFGYEKISKYSTNDLKIKKSRAKFRKTSWHILYLKSSEKEKGGHSPRYPLVEKESKGDCPLYLGEYPPFIVE